MHEDMSMANFAWLIRATSSKARNEIKIDIVKPIPPKKPTPKMCLQHTFAGNLDHLFRTMNQVNKTIPAGLPRTKPKMIPKSRGLINCVKEKLLIEKAVFASAKTGIINSATGICRAFSNLFDILSLLPLPKGITKAKSTPLIEACTPDLSIQYHKKIPPSR
jgi:hypothetical protein